MHRDAEAILDLPENPARNAGCTCTCSCTDGMLEEEQQTRVAASEATARSGTHLAQEKDLGGG